MEKSKSMSRLNCSPSTLPSSGSAASSGRIKDGRLLRRSLSSNNLGRSANPGNDNKPRRRRIKYQPPATTENKKKEENGRRDAGRNDDSMNIASTESGWGHTSVSHIQSTEAFHNSIDSSMVASMWSFSKSDDSNAFEEWDVMKTSYKAPDASKAQDLCNALDKHSASTGVIYKNPKNVEQSSSSLSTSSRTRKHNNKESGNHEGSSTSARRRPKEKVALSQH